MMPLELKYVPEIFHDPALDTFVGGVIPTLPDARDRWLPRMRSSRRLALARTNHDLRVWGPNGESMCMPVGNQGRIGSCTAWGWAYERRGMLSVRDHMLTGRPVNLNDTMSPRFVYDMERGPLYLNTYPQDSGADMRSGADILIKMGCSPEADLPYTGLADNGPLDQEFTPHVMEAAGFYGASGYYRLGGTGNTLVDAILGVLDQGYPVGIAIMVPISFEQVGGNGWLAVPGVNDQVLGGHDVTIVGNFIDARFQGGGCFIIQNHWGTLWGDVNNGNGGFAYMPFEWASVNTRLYGPWLSEAWMAA